MKSKLVIIFLLFTLITTTHAEKIYIDITSPHVKKLPIAIENFIGGSEISDIVKDDLTFTGLFDCIEDVAFIERPEQPFNPANWRGLGVEIVVKGRVVKSSGLSVIVSAYDVSNGSVILKKEYSGSLDLLRPIAHTIANDIYKALTGQTGIFRTKIAFVGKVKGSNREANSELYIMDWDGHRIHGLGITGGVILSPKWSYDRTKLIYSAERNRNWNIYILDMTTMKETVVVGFKGLNLAGNFFSNNREFVFSSLSENKSNIYIQDIVSMKERKIISSPWIDVSPSVSFDGNHILFVSNRSGSPQIYISDKDGSGIRRLTFEGSYNTSPTWSPKGDRIAYVRMVDGKNQIFIIKADGTGQVQLTYEGNNEDPSFSPDGRYIAFTSDRDGSKGIYLMKADGKDQKRITPKKFEATSPNWSAF